MKPIFIHVPKTGGVNLRNMFGEHIQSKGHTQAVNYREEIGREAWDSAWTFAFVRNPWARAASYYLSRKLQGVNFLEWCRRKEQGLSWGVGHPDRRASTLLCDYGGRLIVDTVFRYEEYGQALAVIQNTLGTNILMAYANISPKPEDFHYRDLYCEETRRRVAAISSWEINRFGYEF